MKGKWINICFILIIVSIIMCEDSKDKAPVTEKEQTKTNVTEIPEMTEEVAKRQYSSTVKRDPETPAKEEEEKNEEVKEDNQPKEEKKEEEIKKEVKEETKPKENTSNITTNQTKEEEHHLRVPENPSLPEYTHKNSSAKEDVIARNWIYIFTVCITICLVLFIYNVIKCYTKNPIVQQPSDTATYSKELQQISANEDDVLDMS